MEDVILMLGKIRDAEEDDISDQICLADGHTVFHCVQLLIVRGRVDVETIYPLVRPGGLSQPDDVAKIRSLLEKEMQTNLGWFSSPIEMRAFQAASALTAIDLVGTYAVAYSALIKQIQANGNVIRNEVDSASGVFGKMHLHDPVDMCPTRGEMTSRVVLRIFPSQTDQLIARNIPQCMSPDASKTRRSGMSKSS